MTTVKKRQTTQAQDATVVRSERRTWSPGQIISGLVGLGLTVMGGVALARLLPTDSLTGATVEVFGVGHTVIMGIVAVGLGLLFLSEAASPFAVQRGMISLGVVTLAFGLIVVIEPSAFDNALGIGQAGGWLYTVIGFISVVTGMVSPIITSRTG